MHNLNYMSSHFISSETLKDGDVVHVHLDNDVIIGKAIIIREGNKSRLIETDLLPKN